MRRSYATQQAGATGTVDTRTDVAALEHKLVDLAKLVRTAQECQQQSDILRGLQEQQLVTSLQSLQQQVQKLHAAVFSYERSPSGIQPNGSGDATAAAALKGPGAAAPAGSGQCASKHQPAGNSSSGAAGPVQQGTEVPTNGDEALLLARRDELRAVASRLEAVEVAMARLVSDARQVEDVREQSELFTLERLMALEGSIADSRVEAAAGAAEQRQKTQELAGRLAVLEARVGSALGWLGGAWAEVGSPRAAEAAAGGPAGPLADMVPAGPGCTDGRVTAVLPAHDDAVSRTGAEAKPGSKQDVGEVATVGLEEDQPAGAPADVQEEPGAAALAGAQPGDHCSPGVDLGGAPCPGRVGGPAGSEQLRWRQVLLPPGLQSAVERAATAAALAAWEARAGVQSEGDACRVQALAAEVQRLSQAHQALSAPLERLVALWPRLEAALDGTQQQKQRQQRTVAAAGTASAAPAPAAGGVSGGPGGLPGAASGAERPMGHDAQLLEAYHMAREAGGLVEGIKGTLAEVVARGSTAATSQKGTRLRWPDSSCPIAIGASAAELAQKQSGQPGQPPPQTTSRYPLQPHPDHQTQKPTAAVTGSAGPAALLAGSFAPGPAASLTAVGPALVATAPPGSAPPVVSLAQLASCPAATGISAVTSASASGFGLQHPAQQLLWPGVVAAVAHPSPHPGAPQQHMQLQPLTEQLSGSSGKGSVAATAAPVLLTVTTTVTSQLPEAMSAPRQLSPPPMTTAHAATAVAEASPGTNLGIDSSAPAVCGVEGASSCVAAAAPVGAGPLVDVSAPLPPRPDLSRHPEDDVLLSSPPLSRDSPPLSPHSDVSPICSARSRSRGHLRSATRRHTAGGGSRHGADAAAASPPPSSFLDTWRRTGGHDQDQDDRYSRWGWLSDEEEADGDWKGVDTKPRGAATAAAKRLSGARKGVATVSAASTAAALMAPAAAVATGGGHKAAKVGRKAGTHAGLLSRLDLRSTAAAAASGGPGYSHGASEATGPARVPTAGRLGRVAPTATATAGASASAHQPAGSSRQKHQQQPHSLGIMGRASGAAARAAAIDGQGHNRASRLGRGEAAAAARRSASARAPASSGFDSGAGIDTLPAAAAVTTPTKRGSAARKALNRQSALDLDLKLAFYSSCSSFESLSSPWKRRRGPDPAVPEVTTGVQSRRWAIGCGAASPQAGAAGQEAGEDCRLRRGGGGSSSSGGGGRTSGGGGSNSGGGARQRGGGSPLRQASGGGKAQLRGGPPVRRGMAAAPHV